MGRHKQWRKIAKRERRRKIRICHALKRKESCDEDSKEYKSWLTEQDRLELFEREEIERQNALENEKWINADNIAFNQWKQLKEKIEMTRLKNLEDEIKIQKEWENEQIRVREMKAKLKELEEETKKQHNIFMEKLELFLNGGVREPPTELLNCRETKPNMEACPFFTKTACCRFGDVCSRNHKYPGITKVLLAPNFYTHFGLENSNVTEYEDVMLEYDDNDTYKDFKDFFYDVLPEFQRYGEVVELKVCHNYEKHLRGNTYIQFNELRCAVAAYRGLHARWYGGRQLSLQFCNISSWKNAICGLQLNKRCPKGRACNFLHVFRNPISLQRCSSHSLISREREQERQKSWRWSESPEVEIKERERHKSRKDSKERPREKKLRSPKSNRHKSRNERS